MKKIPVAEQIYIIYSPATKMPYVFCEEGSFDDCVHVYLSEEEAKEECKKMVEEKHPVLPVKCEKKTVLNFFAELRYMGINAICFYEGEDRHLAQLEDIVTVQKLVENQIENPALHLSMLYFMQEMRRPVASEEKKGMKELEEETSANLAKARFLVPSQTITQGEGEEAKEVKSFVFLKNDKEEVFLPLFTDLAEARKFGKGKEFQLVATDVLGVIKVLNSGEGNVTGVVVNSASSNVIINKLGVLAIQKRFLS